MDETVELNRLAGRAIINMMGEGAGLEARLSPNCCLCLSGEPVADLNMMFVGPDDDAADFLKDAMARVDHRKLPLLALFTPHVAEVLASFAESLGLAAAGAVPLMVLRSATPVRLGRMCHIEEARTPEKVAIAGDLSAAAFSLPRDSVARAFDAGMTESSIAQTYIGARDGEPMSAVTVTRTGRVAGVWNMSTPPEHQRKGMGRALLTGVIREQRDMGVDRFFLFATQAGRPLYESIGFEAIADYSVWVKGHSTQVPL